MVTMPVEADRRATVKGCPLSCDSREPDGTKIEVFPLIASPCNHRGMFGATLGVDGFSENWAVTPLSQNPDGSYSGRKYKWR